MPNRETPHEHIVRIRREIFSLDETGYLVTRNPLAERLQRAVDLLSEGLYTKDTHFVLELIQNAEDNAYPPERRPDLAFRILTEDPTQTPQTDGALLVVNNEIGLRPEDVDALCDVGGTTKVKRQGYIGEKGIGFKSVFNVSPRPHIFSAGYQFRFHREPDPEARLGFIVPYWVPMVYAQLNQWQSNTCILLPLDASKRQLVVEELKKIAPETILFLNRLDALTVELPGERSLQIVRDVSRRPFVDLLIGENYARYWVAEREITAPTDLFESKREGIRTRTVTVAFPLDAPIGEPSLIYAFLPTEVISGYPFLVNADFLLSASRETLQKDRAWNRWLRDEISLTFVEGFESLVHDPEHRYDAYKFIPLPDQVTDDFFRPPVDAIYEALKTRDVVWVVGKQAPVAPAMAIFAPKKFRELLQDKALPTRLCEIFLVEPELEQYRNQLGQIGVGELRQSDVVACLQDDTWLASHDWPWFANLYSYLSEQSWATKIRLHSLKIMPLESGDLAGVGQWTLYSPSEVAQEIIEKHSQLLGNLGSIGFLHHELDSIIKNDQKLQQWINHGLGIREWTVGDYCVELAHALGSAASTLDIKALVHLSAYIRDQYKELSATQQRAIRLALPLALADGTIVYSVSEQDGSRPLVTPAGLNPESGWQIVFPDSVDRQHLQILSDAYLDVEGRWNDFFQAIGVTSAPPPARRQWTWYFIHNKPYDMPPDLSNQVDDIVEAAGTHSTRSYELRDWSVPRWLEVLSSAGARELRDQKSIALLHWVRDVASVLNHPSYRSELRWFRNKKRSNPLVSHLHHVLLTTPWFPTTQGPQRPDFVFLDKPELRDLFGDRLPYAIENPGASVAEWLHIRTEATGEQILSYLSDLAKQPAEQIQMDVLQKIYAFLMERWLSKYRGRFQQESLILVRRPFPRWVRAANAVWTDLSDVFEDVYAYLEPEYPARLHDFFVKQVGVAERLDDELYAKAWQQLAQTPSPDPKKVESSLERIYPVLLKVAESDPKPPWWKGFLEQAEVWTQNNMFFGGWGAFVPDDGDLKEIFGKNGAEFAWRPAKASFDEFMPLYRSLGVRSLVETIQSRMDVEPVFDEQLEDPMLTPAAKRAICMYLWNSAKTEYEQLRENGVLKAFLSSQEVVTERLSVTYILDGITSVKADSVAYFDREGSRLYCTKDAPREQLEIEVPTLVARTLSRGRTSQNLANLIGRVLGASEQKVTLLARQSNWHLPTEEQAWIAEQVSSQPGMSKTATKFTENQEQKDVSRVDERVTGFSSAETAAANTASSGKSKSAGDQEGGTAGRRSTENQTSGGTRRGMHTGGEEGRRDRRVTYIESTGNPGDTDDEGEDSEDPRAAEERRALEEAGIRAAAEYERQSRRIPKVLNHSHKGWDIDSYERTLLQGVDSVPEDRLVRRIEVKTKRGTWDGWGVGLTPEQHHSAQEHRTTYYLYVVEYALDRERCRLFVFADPISKIHEYRLDENWRDLSDDRHPRKDD